MSQTKAHNDKPDGENNIYLRRAIGHTNKVAGYSQNLHIKFTVSNRNQEHENVL
jgi:hypothetical protein